MDCFTDWPDIVEMRNTESESVIRELRKMFCRTAAPDVLWTDGGPQFTSQKFLEFLRSWGIIHTTLRAMEEQKLPSNR